MNEPNIIIRRATEHDAEALCELYTHHLNTETPDATPDMARWRARIRAFESDEHYHIIVAETDGGVVSSVTLVIIENLTHDMRPYAVIEFVVTHADARNRGLATMLMNRAGEIAEQFGCYKIMLMTGAKLTKTLDFYRNCGFNSDDKTGFVRWLDGN
ncbi:MAG: GNAT family N-acetyltransferase [Oscillospiraceae bacterium]|jgi:GNAT superfamily N-acetyltransferase|nr:GNAT family N-acetyltransferase [Oscillospiraceae bacterium]